ncbi:hypothetical protein K491DRAFT_692893 [Lophiostoma macrostomum CBS 122681]|uniref:Uncharacterized protein n=1 Tax=Lophiostoma macrostomum CBS 122681 TaxID=1314788 RepID=A0A6A6T992_9PLEO|nr:hypothetical protein K491DRAFT_692893 [Lophiostoma macrostomum CBS 122681]
MPTHTPSPHRFLAPTSARKSKTRPPSSLRQGITAQTPRQTHTASQSHVSPSAGRKVIPAKRFVIAPARQTRSTAHAAVRSDEAGPSTQHATPRPRPRKLKKVESIHESSQESPSASAEPSGGILQTTEFGSTHLFPESQEPSSEQEDEDAEILFASEEKNKRRRLSPQLPSSPTSMRNPQTPVPNTASTSSHRFLVPAPKTPAPFSNTSHTPTATANPTATPAPSRPHFLLPPQPTSPAKPSTPLPETFSPSRKGQKYVPGGLASTLQSWILETASSGYAAVNRDAVVWGRERGDGVKIRVRVKSANSGKTGVEDRDSEACDGNADVDCHPGGVVFVRGETDAGLYNASRLLGSVREGGEIKVMLAGQGGARGSGGVNIKAGGSVGVRAPLWDVDLGREKWMVGVDWALL